MNGVGAIHISEIEPTLKKLEKVLGIPLMKNTLGSVGKKEFSGDIDIALEIDNDEIPAFMEKLKSIPEIKDMAKTSVIMTKVEIAEFDDSKETDKPRTGYVQVDFMPGDPGWLKTYYHSPHSKDSKYKGHYRNVMIAIIASEFNRQESKETIEDGRPLSVERYKWSPTDGLVRVVRSPKPKKSGKGYTTQHNDEIIGGPWKDPNEIAQQLKLGKSGSALYSFETLHSAVRTNYPTELQHKIFMQFANNEQVKDMGVPDEVSEFEHKMIESQLESLVKEAVYDGNIGMIEMLKFYKSATPAQIAKLKKLIQSGNKDRAWDLIELVTSVKLNRNSL